MVCAIVFWAAAPRQEEEKNGEVAAAAVPETFENGILGKYGLDDWKISVPIGLAVSIPAISNNVSFPFCLPRSCVGYVFNTCMSPQFYVLNEETQLACCFLLFCTSVYKFGGDSIASYFDSRAAAILA